MEWTQDYTALVVSYAYVLAVLAVAELLRSVGKQPVDVTRKLIHIGVGMWVVGTVLLFERWEFAIIPPVTFVLINAFSYWRGTFKAMEGEEQSQLGTIYFPISFAALIYAMWGQPVLLVASLMPMTWGDAMASLFGRHYGHYQYTVAGRTRSVEGSVAMLFWGWLATFVALFGMPFLIGAPAVNWALALIYSGVVAVVCTFVEALSPWGIDNLTVPAATALVLQAFLG